MAWSNRLMDLHKTPRLPSRAAVCFWSPSARASGSALTQRRYAACTRPACAACTPLLKACANEAWLPELESAASVIWHGAE